MKIRILEWGTLRVTASDMCRGVGPGEIATCYPPDPEGKMLLAMNGLLIEAEDRVVLVDPGCADFMPKKFTRMYGLQLPGSLDQVIGRAGFGPGDVTDVVFTHLHFDHGSGAFRREPGRIAKRYNRARYHVLKAHFDYAVRPDKKESDAFFSSLFRYTGKPSWLEEWPHDWMRFEVFDGHTRSMAVPKITGHDMDTWYLTDLVPMELFLEPAVSSGYDLDPDRAVGEKSGFLKKVIRPCRFIFFHDPLRKEITYR